MASKGKDVATGEKRRRGDVAEDDRARSDRKRRNREILQFFEDTADVDEEESDYSDFDDEEYDIELKVKKEPVKTPNLSFIPKEEVIDEEEFDKMMEERYRTRSGFVRYPEDAYEDKSGETASGFPPSKDPKIWKVKCMIGREKHSAFCLMQKFVDLKSLGTKLQIISAFSFDHVKGFIFIEADKQCDINEACKGLCGIYTTRVSLVPQKEVHYLFSVRRKTNVISEGMWVRVKYGKYKGDLAQVVCVNDARKKATVKLIPRIDMQLLAKKIGGGVAIKNAATPAPKLINSSELEEFRPLIQYRRDRDTGLMVEVLDGLMFKDGYLYKKVSVDSLNISGVMPSEEELMKFQPSENNDADNSEWLSQLYGSPKKKRTGNDKSGEKGESSSGSGVQNGFQLYDLVFVGRKDFGLIVGMEKDDYYKILKNGPEAPIVSTVARREIKSGPSDMKFSALDRHSKNISVNDTIKVLEGPLKDRQGIVKHIYRGVIFLHDENEIENGGYFCCKSQMCEKIKMSADVCSEKGGESGFFGFEDGPSSPKSPLSPKKPWQTFESKQEFNQGDKEGMFSIGQTLRIRIGPLKGYLCRVLAIRYSEATVKLDSQHKVLTVKFEHLSEVKGRNAVIPSSEDPGSSSFKPFDMLGSEGGTGWTDGAGTSADGAGGNTESTPWPSFSSSGLKPQPDSSGTKEEDSAWGRKETPSQNASWGAAANKESDDCWNKAASNVGSSSGGSEGWGKPKLDSGSSPHGAAEAWGNGKLQSENPSGSWDKSADTGDDNWNNASKWNQQKSDSSAKGPTESWGTGGSSWAQTEAKDIDAASGWTKAKVDGASQAANWGKQDGGEVDGSSKWGYQEGGSSWNKQDGGSKQEASWGKQEGDSRAKQDGWSAQNDRGGGGGSTWGKKDGGSSSDNTNSSGWGNKDGDSQGSGWGNKSSWSTPNTSEQNSNWKQKSEENEDKDKGDGWNGGKSSDAKGWVQSSSWTTASNGTGKNDDSCWGKKSGGNTSSSWGKGGDRNSDAKQESDGWGKKSSWNQDSSVTGGGGDDRTENSGGGRGWRGGGFGGRGGSDRGGYRGGRGERGGGYRGRGRSDRGGYGDRGRRDQGGDNASDWKSGGGWSSGGGGGSWNQGGAEKSGGWSSGGGGGSWNQGGAEKSGGWSSGGGGSGGGGSWNQGGAEKSGGSGGGGGSWNQGGGGEKSGGSSGGGDASKSWNESGGGQSSAQDSEDGNDAEEANPWSAL